MINDRSLYPHDKRQRRRHLATTLICHSSFVMALLLSPLAALSATFTDDVGQTTDWRTPPMRVVALAPSLTELVYAAGAGHKLVGVDRASDHPAAVAQLPRVGDYMRVDIERLLQLKPDVVLVWASGNTGRELAQLAAAGVPAVRLEPQRLTDVALAIERLGEWLGTAHVAQKNAAQLRATLAALQAEHAQKKPVSVFYQVWSQPLLTLNDQHVVSDALRLCGARNVFGALKPLVPEVSVEAVLAAQPDLIVAARESKDGDLAARRTPQLSTFALWQTHARHLKAVQRGALYTLPGDVISRPGPRIAQGVRALCEAVDAARKLP
jgi:iron complex transport system substrate-binding protein